MNFSATGTKKTIILPIGTEGGGKSGVIKAATEISNLPLISFCCNLNEVNPTRKPRQEGEDRVFINSLIMDKLLAAGCVLSQAKPSSYNNQVIYVYLNSLPENLLTVIDDYNLEFQSRYQVNYYTAERRQSLRIQGSLQSLTDGDLMPILEFDPPGVLDIAGKLAKQYDVLIPVVFGVGIRALIDAQMTREGYTPSNCPQDKLELYRQKAQKSFWSSNSYIWDILREGKKGLEYKAFPIPNFSNFDDYKSILQTFKDYLSLKETDSVKAEAIRHSIYVLCGLNLELERYDLDRLGAGFGEGVNGQGSDKPLEQHGELTQQDILGLFRFACQFHLEQNEVLRLKPHEFKNSLR